MVGAALAGRTMRSGGKEQPSQLEAIETMLRNDRSRNVHSTVLITDTTDMQEDIATFLELVEVVDK